MRVLLTGSGGQLGREFARRLAGQCELSCAARDDSGDLSLDLADPESLNRALTQVRPELIINCAAWTAVDQAEACLDEAMRVNAVAVGEMAQWARRHDARLLHFSTDYVFAGDAQAPYPETAPIDPINAYGRSKAAGEAAVRESGCAHMIFRTAWVYASHGRNFLQTMLKYAKQGQALRVVDDQHGSPTWAGQLAELSWAAAQGSSRSGTWHLSARGETTWYGFAEALLRAAVEQGLLAQMPELKAVSSDEFPTPAARPGYSVLDNTRFERDFGLTVPHWRRQLELCIKELAC